MINPNALMPTVLTIAGTDPSGGAGIQADIKTISATGSYAASIITAIVSQNTQGVQAIHPMTKDTLITQIHSVFGDLAIKTVKVGMLYNDELIKTVATCLSEFNIHRIVLDPVMNAKDGASLLQSTMLTSLKHHILPLAFLITPNIVEAERLINQSINDFGSMKKAAKILAHEYKVNVLIKGGHLHADTASDLLYCYENKALTWFHCTRIETLNTHGTGCTLSAAIASYLAQDYTLVAAIRAAKKYVTRALLASKQWRVGQGCGPLDHFHALRRKSKTM